MQTIIKASVIIILLVFAIYYYPYLSPAAITAFIERHRITAPLIFIVICAVRPVLFFVPSLGLTVVAGVMFGAVWGTIYVALGGAISTVVGYFFAKWLGRDSVKRLAGLNKYVKMFNEWSDRYGRDSVLFMRIFNMPWDMVSYWAGLTGINFRDFYIASMIPLLPVSFIYTYFGSKIHQPLSAGFVISLLGILLLSAIPYIRQRFFRKAI